MTLKTGQEMSPNEARAFYLAYDGVKSEKLESAEQCPFTPLQEGEMNAWLQGYVTATDELEQA